MGITFSVIIPAYNEAANIRKCIRSVKESGRGEEILNLIVVDNGSTDSTLEIAKEEGLDVIENTSRVRKTIAALRNSGGRRARGDVLVFLDADIVVPDNFFHRANGFFSGGFKGVLGFVERVPQDAGLLGKVWSECLFLKRSRLMEVDFLPGRNLFVNREVFEKINGFNESLTTCEDKDFTFRAIKAGFKVMSVPDTTYIHLGYEKSLWEFVKKEFWRQGSTLDFARLWNFSFRSLRNPMLSFWHIIFLLLFVSAVVFFKSAVVLTAAVLWLLPAVVITVRTGVRRNAGFYFIGFVLEFLRWNISGVALVTQLLKGKPFRTEISHLLIP